MSDFIAFSNDKTFSIPTSLFTYQFQAEPCRCSRGVAPIIERIDLGCASNLMRVLISLTAADYERAVEQ